MTHLARRDWVPAASEDYIEEIARSAASAQSDWIERRIGELVDENREIHERQCINLNPATNLMNPKAEAMLAQGLSSRPSLGYPGDKYEMGLEAIEKIEVIAAQLAAETFDARFAEIRVGSGALANLYAFMATTRPGQSIIVPDVSIGGHVTHHEAGAAGLYGLRIHSAPVDPLNYGIDVEALAALARRERPRLITVGGSLNLFPHPVGAIRAIADEVGAAVLFDAAHQSGLIAGRVWPNPLKQGAHLMTMSTYKSLGGPAAGLIVTDEPQLARRLDRIAFPGLTANFDAAKAAALAITLLDWREHGGAYATTMVETAAALARALEAGGAPVFKTARGITASHQLALDARRYGGGQAAARKLRRANLLACGIGLPVDTIAGDLNGLRLGTPEIVRIGMTPDDMPELARLIVAGLEANDPTPVAIAATRMRERFKGLAFVR
jgi:glycine hydroxymethyltransferase